MVQTTSYAYSRESVPAVVYLLPYSTPFDLLPVPVVFKDWIISYSWSVMWY
jgi:hypothetical protein